MADIASPNTMLATISDLWWIYYIFKWESRDGGQPAVTKGAGSVQGPQTESTVHGLHSQKGNPLMGVLWVGTCCSSLGPSVGGRHRLRLALFKVCREQVLCWGCRMARVEVSLRSPNGAAGADPGFKKGGFNVVPKTDTGGATHNYL